MRRLLLSITLILFGFTLVQAQTLLSENFSGTNFPPTAWSIDAHPTNWAQSGTTNAGGAMPEVVFNYYPSFVGTSRLISPQVNTTGYTSITLAFNHFVDWYSNNYTIGVATTSGAGTVWNIAWQQTVSGNVGPQMKIIDINNSDVGTSDFKFCLFFSGDSYDLDYWYIDDILLFHPYALDLAAQSINMPTYNLGNEAVKGKLMNFGQTTITAADVNWQIGAGPVHTTSLSGFSIALGEAYDFVASDSTNLAPGIYDLNLWISNINGPGPDSNAVNDSLTKHLSIATQSALRKPCYEDFTSSTCAPCASFNSSVFNSFVANHEQQITMVHYCMSWPSPGDPYYTDEGGVRRFFYGCSYVPDVYVDGSQIPTTSQGVNGALTSSLDNPSFMTLQGTYMITGSIVDIQMDIIPYITGNLNAYIAVCERLTTGNVGNNGETSWHHVMMKMVPDAYGTNLDLVSGNTTTLNYSVDMSSTFVEQMSDLMVVFWVQDTSTRALFQSENATLITGINNVTNDDVVRIYPNPSTGMVSLKSGVKLNKIEIFDQVGQQVLNIEGFTSESLDCSNLPNGTYSMKVYSVEGVQTFKLMIIQ